MIKRTEIVVDNVGKKTIGELNDYVKNLEQALDEIEKYIENHKRESESHIYGLTIPKFVFDGEIEDIEEIIQKAKGDVKNENNNV